MTRTHSRGPARNVVCPTCRGPSRYAADNSYRPFCSERCRAIDLGAWADERYRVGAPSDDRRDDDADALGRAEH
jgi:endogenous inhibitor of DNA gyrase (YacG/DUF329 family)